MRCAFAAVRAIPPSPPPNYHSRARACTCATARSSAAAWPLHAARNVAFVPCGHIASCKECAGKMDECPLCKRVIQQRVAVYLP